MTYLAIILLVAFLLIAGVKVTIENLIGWIKGLGNK